MTKPPSPTAWIDTVDPRDITAAHEQGAADACDADEVTVGLATIASESLVFPFPAKVMGQAVQVVDSEFSEGDAPGLDLIVEFNGQRHRIAARSVALISPLPEGAECLAALLDWKGP